MSRLAKTTLGAAALVAIFAGSGKATAAEAEVAHWWVSGGESAAIQVIADQFEKAGNTWIDTGIAGSGSTARPLIISRILGGDPPAAAQFNTGRQFEDLVAQGLLRDLEEVAGPENWRDFLPGPFLEAITFDGKIYAASVNIHGENWVWYNKPLFEEIGAPVPETWEDLIAAADKLQAAGKVAIALGGQPWQERILFNTVLIGTGGKDLYMKVYGDQDFDVIRGPAFRTATERFAGLRAYVDEGSPGRNWNDATNMVITGQAGMQFMGDWAKGEFVAAGKTPDVDYGCTLSPGNVNFQMVGDVFVFPKTDDAAVTDAQNKLASIMMNPETQVLFNAKKGSVPVRSDVDTSQLDPCAEKGLAVAADKSKQIPGMDFLLTTDLSTTLQDTISVFWNSPEMTVDEFVENFVSTIESAGG